MNDIINEVKEFHNSDEAKVKLLGSILHPYKFNCFKFQAPANSTTSEGLFCPLIEKFNNPGQLSIVILTNGLIELFIEV